MRYFNLNNKATALCSLIGNTPSVVFDVDAAVFDNLKRRFFIDNPTLERMTDEDMNRMIIARGASMVHVNKYDGTFEKPVFIIGRLLSAGELSEVEAPK